MTALSDDVVAARAPWSAVVRAGQHLQIIDLHGNQAVDTLFYSAADTAVRYSARTRSRPGQRLPDHGSVLRASNGDALMTIVADERRLPRHHRRRCSKESNTLRYGHHTVHQHACVENFLAEASLLGHGQARHRLQHQLLHERARGGRWRLGIVDGLSAPGLA